MSAFVNVLLLGLLKLTLGKSTEPDIADWAAFWQMADEKAPARNIEGQLLSHIENPYTKTKLPRDVEVPLGSGSDGCDRTKWLMKWAKHLENSRAQPLLMTHAETTVIGETITFTFDLSNNNVNLQTLLGLSLVTNSSLSLMCITRQDDNKVSTYCSLVGDELLVGFDHATGISTQKLVSLRGGCHVLLTQRLRGIVHISLPFCRSSDCHGPIRVLGDPYILTSVF